MKARLLAAFLAIPLFTFIAGARAQQQLQQLPMPQISLEGQSVLRVPVPDKQTLDTILGFTDDVWSHHVEVGGTIDIHVTPAQRAAIDAAGIPYEVFIENLQPLVAAERVRPLRDATFFDSYHTYDEVVAFLDDMVATYPNLAQKIDLGYTYGFEHIWGLRITGNPTPGFKPAVLYIGCQHAREWITVAMTTFLIDHLLTNYGVDPEVTDLVDRVEWFIVPIANPDGYIYTWTTSRLWRKNRRPAGDGAIGIDINRNWATGWGLDEGSSPNPGSEIYRGPSAFSEPETRRFRDFIDAHPNIRAFSDIHSYSELILWPWGFTPDETADSAEYSYVGNQMGNRIQAVHGHYYGRGPIYSAIYPVSGDSGDWTYAEHGILSIGFELRDRGQYGFVLPPSEIVPASEEIVPALVFMTSWVAPKLLIDLPEGVPPLSPGQEVLDVPVEIGDSGEIVQPGTETLYYNLNGEGPFIAAPLTHVSGDSFLAEIPIGCASFSEFYIEAQSTAGTTVRSPRNAPVLLHTAEHTTPIAVDAGPVDVWRCIGGTVTFDADAVGVGPLEYQWRRDGVPIAGATDPSFTIDPVGSADLANYDVVVTDICGNNETSAPLHLHEADLTFTQSPTSISSCPHLSPVLTAATDVTTGVTYQWYRNDVPVPGATAPQLPLPDITFDDEGEYYCVATLDCVQVESERAQVDVPRLDILAHPQSQCANSGEDVTFAVDVEGDGVNIQWRKDGVVIPDESGPTLTIPSVDASDAGEYYVVAYTFPGVCVDITEHAHLIVDTCTTCGSPLPGDLDGDNDRDLADFAMLQECFDASGAIAPGCACADISGDGLIDDLDFRLFRSDITGP